MRFIPYMLTVLLLLPLWGGAVAAHPVMRIVYPDYHPFFSSDHGEMSGFFYEIVTEALARMGVTPVGTPFLGAGARRWSATARRMP